MEPLRLSQAEKELGVSRSTLKRWILDGAIQTVKTRGGHHRIPPSEIERIRLRGKPKDLRVEPDAHSLGDEKPHILVVDDVKDTRDLLVKLISDWGYDVTTATEATEALELAQDLLVDAYILDNMMPGSSGIDLCRRIREHDASTPIIFYSGFDGREQALKAQAQAYILKPHFEELRETIDSYLKAGKQV
jgi:excisionase family DNA binding protein